MTWLGGSQSFQLPGAGGTRGQRPTGGRPVGDVSSTGCPPGSAQQLGRNPASPDCPQIHGPNRQTPYPLLDRMTRHGTQRLCRVVVPHRQVPAGVSGQRLCRPRRDAHLGSQLRARVQRRSSPQRHLLRRARSAARRQRSRHPGGASCALALHPGARTHTRTMVRPHPQLDADRRGHPQPRARLGRRLAGGGR